jgi:hypothetical protein
MGVAPAGAATANKASAAAASRYRRSMATPFPDGTGPGGVCSKSHAVPEGIRKALKSFIILLTRKLVGRISAILWRCFP